MTVDPAATEDGTEDGGRAVPAGGHRDRPARPPRPARLAGHPVRPRADRVPPPRPPRERALRLGDRPGDGRAGRAADRGPRPAAVAARVRGGAARGPRAAGRRARRAADRDVRRGADRRTASRTTTRVYAAALEPLREQGLVYACTCARSTFAAYEASAGRPWRGHRLSRRVSRARRSPRTATPGCGWRSGPARSAGWTSSRGRWPTSRPRPATRSCATGWATGRTRGAWSWTTRGTAIDLVIRGRDLLDATPVQLRLARLLGRETPPQFLHHPLIRRVSGQKLSKAAGDTAVRSLLDAGRTPAELFGSAARLAGLRGDRPPIEPRDLGSAFDGPDDGDRVSRPARGRVTRHVADNASNPGHMGERCARRRSRPASSRCGSSAPTSTRSSRSG